MIFADQTLQFLLGFLDLILGRCGIDHLRIQHFTCLVHYRQLTAGTESGVPAENYLSRNGRLHQKLLQVLAEN